jgi:hypothetical protein
MAKPPANTPQPPRRIVHYQIIVDALGPRIKFTTDVPVLPKDVPPHLLPPDATIRWERLEFVVTGGTADAHTLRRRFMELAEAANWEIHLQT